MHVQQVRYLMYTQAQAQSSTRLHHIPRLLLHVGPSALRLYHPLTLVSSEGCRRVL
jgi:hypothetical protein